MAEQAKWYVIHTYSGYENKVAQNIEKVVENRRLHDMIPAIRIPTELVSEIKEGKKSEAERKLFPSYVLVKMVLTDDTWYIVRNTRGVTGFVGPGSKPVPLTEKEVIALGVDLDNNVVSSTVSMSFKTGDTIVIHGGSLDGFTGIVQEINLEEGTVDVTVSMFGRETPATIPIAQVSPCEDY